jgi:hypothetical protein
MHYTNNQKLYFITKTPLSIPHPLEKHKLFYYFLSFDGRLDLSRPFHLEARINVFLIPPFERGLTHLISSPLRGGTKVGGEDKIKNIL